MIRRGAVDLSGLPLADAAHTGLAPYKNITLAGWDLYPDDLASACRQHGVLAPAELDLVRTELELVKPWPAIGNVKFCRNVAGREGANLTSMRDQIDSLKDDLKRFKAESGVDSLVVVHLASTERSWPIPRCRARARRRPSSRRSTPTTTPIGPAMLYAYAAIDQRACPYGNFTPSVAADIPALTELARRSGVPIAGKDGKTGQTLMKTVLAPALRAPRAARRRLVLDQHPRQPRRPGAGRSGQSLKSKLDTKGCVLDSILGYQVEDHIVDIRYYRPRGDDKEAWDNIDITGFLGHRMQMKVNFLCKDSILAAPLAIEIARVPGPGEAARRWRRAGAAQPVLQGAR